MISIKATRTGEQLMEESCLKDQVSQTSPQLWKPVYHYKCCSFRYLSKSYRVQTVPIFAINPLWTFLPPTGLGLHCILILLWNSFTHHQKTCGSNSSTAIWTCANHIPSLNLYSSSITKWLGKEQQISFISWASYIHLLVDVWKLNVKKENEANSEFSIKHCQLISDVCPYAMLWPIMI